MNQEAQKEVQYPHVLQCVFCGAKGLFIDCLIRNTSAHIVVSRVRFVKLVYFEFFTLSRSYSIYVCIYLLVNFFQVGSVGCLLISGLVEPVVKAYSLVVDLAEKYSSSQTQPFEARSDSMDSRRTFKSMVERLEDSHTLELLVLPVMVKEVLLDLVKQSGLDPSTLDSGVVSAGATKSLKIQESMDRLMLRESKENQNLEILKSTVISPRANGTSFFNFPNYRINNAGKQDNQAEPPSQFFSCLVAGTEPRPDAASASVKKQDREVQKWSEGISLDTEGGGKSKQEEKHGESIVSTASKQENEHLLNFFTAMGFNDEVVCRVLARTGPREPSQVLDLIQQEHDKTVIQIIKQEVNGAPGNKDEDFVLGVMKKAAASCGYTEEKVAEIYSNLPELKPHELILELQRKGMRESSGRNDSDKKKGEETEEPKRNIPILQRPKESILKEERKTERVHGKCAMTNTEKFENDRRVHSEGVNKKKQGMQAHGRESSSVEPRMPEHPIKPVKMDVASTKADFFSPSLNRPPFHTISPSVCGPPQPTYPSPQHTNISEERNATAESMILRPKQKHLPSKAGAVITGQQRFLEGLETPFVLQLKDDHGDPGLRPVIIDGSNVAMT